MRLISIMILLLAAQYRADAQADDSLANAGARSNVVRRVTNTFQNTRYEYEVTQSNLDAAPLWREDQPNPPLSMRAAMASAKEAAKKVPNSEDWQITAITLERAGNDRWLYLVHFTTFYKDTILLGPHHSFSVPVLFNSKTPDLYRLGGR